MRIMFISCKNKNPLIYFEQEKPNILSSKNMKKMHEKCKYIEKGGAKEIYISLKTKNLERFVEENDKNGLDWIGRRKV